MVRRTGRGAEAPHLLHQERKEGAFVLDGGLGHRVEVGLIRAAAALGNHYEAIFATLSRFDVDLRWEVALRVHLVIHIQRSVLAVAEILLGVAVEHTTAKRLFILEIGPDMLAFLAMDDRGAGVLAERKDALDGSLRVAKELQGHIFVVLARLRIVQDRGHLLVVGPAEHELAIVERLLGDQRQGLGADFEDGLSSASAVASEFRGLHEFLRSGNLVILSLVFAELKHRRILKFSHYNRCYLVSYLTKIANPPELCKSSSPRAPRPLSFPPTLALHVSRLPVLPGNACFITY